MKIKKVLIIGGAGFIGLNLAEFILKNTNYEITIADNFARGMKDNYFTNLILNKKLKLIEADFTKQKSFELLENYDQVYMLASVVGVDNTLSNPSEVIKINSFLILNTLEWIKKSSIKKVLFTSTSENYAGTVDKFNYEIPTSEEVPLCISDISHPRYTYAVTKILGESGFLNYSKQHNFECTILRFHNVYGPRMGFNHVIPNLAERFFNKESPFMMNGYNQTRAFCFISDAIAGTFAAMESNNTNGEIYHIGNEDEVSIEELIKQTGKYFKFKGDYKKAETFPGSTNRRCPNIQKAIKDFAYEPKISLKEGLHITLKWYADYFNK